MGEWVEGSGAVGISLLERSLVISHWSLGRGLIEMMQDSRIWALLLGSFLIVNCQSSIVNETSIQFPHHLITPSPHYPITSFPHSPNLFKSHPH